MHPLSLAALTVLGLSPEEHILCAKKTGYQGVGLRLIPATATETHYPVLSDFSRKARIKKLVKETGVKVLDIEVFRLEPKTVIRDYLPYIEFGVELGTKNMLVAGYDPDWSRMTENWEALCELSHSFGIKPHLEPMPWTYVRSYLDAARLLESTTKNFGAILIDPIHFFRTGGHLDQISSDHISRVSYIQLSDAPIEVPKDMTEVLRQAREDRLPPGEGQLPLRDLLAKFPSDLPISLEVPLSPKWGSKTPEQKASLVLQHTLSLLQA